MADLLAVRVVHEREPEIGVEPHDDILLRLDEPAITQLALAQRFFRLLALGDVLNLRDEVARLAVRVANERRAEKPPDGVAALVPIALLEMVRLRSATERLARMLGRGRDVVGMRQHLEPLPEDL